MTAHVEVTIHGLAAGGDGVGKDPDGRTVFVAATAPGDRVTARVVERHARWARGELVRVDAAGPGRIAPAARPTACSAPTHSEKSFEQRVHAACGRDINLTRVASDIPAFPSPSAT